MKFVSLDACMTGMPLLFLTWSSSDRLTLAGEDGAETIDVGIGANVADSFQSSSSKARCRDQTMPARAMLRSCQRLESYLRAPLCR